MRKKIYIVLLLIICSISGTFNAFAQPGTPNGYYKAPHSHIQHPVKPGKKVHPPKMFSPVGHIYGLSVPGNKIIFNFAPNGRVYKENDNIGRPYLIQGNLITVYNNHGPQRIIGNGKISRDGKIINWIELPNGAKYKLRRIR